MNRNNIPTINELTIPTLLPFHTEKLSNGIEIVSLHDPNQEVFKMDVVLSSGAYHQPHPIIASTMLNLLNEGTKRHTSEEIAEFFDFHGAGIEYNCGLHKSEISLIALCKYATPTIQMVAEMLQESIFPEHELEIYIRNKQQQHLVNLEKTTYLSRREFLRVMYGEQHPYANFFTTKDFNAVSSKLVQDFYHARVHATGCKIIVSGNITPQILQTIKQAFATPDNTLLPPDPEYQFSPATPQRYNISKPDAVQASIRLGKEGVHLTNDDYAYFQLLNMILGGYFGSRLMSNIREEKGFTYNISSFNVCMPKATYWCIATDVNSQQVDATLEEIQKEILRLQQEPVPLEEFNLVKNYFHGELLRELDGVFAQADALKHKLTYGMDNSFYLHIIDRIKKCTPEDLVPIAQKYLDLNQMYTIVAGNV